MNTKIWKARIRGIHQPFYNDLVGTAGCGAFDGGCLIVAKALHKAIGGLVVVIVRRDDTADHAAVLKDEFLWDYDGPLRPQAFIERFNKTEMKYTPWRAIGYRPLQARDLPDAYADEALEGRLAALFERALREQALLSG